MHCSCNKLTGFQKRPGDEVELRLWVIIRTADSPAAMPAVGGKEDMIR